MSGCQGLGKEGQWEVTITVYGIYIDGDENFLKLNSGNGCTKP